MQTVSVAGHEHASWQNNKQSSIKQHLLGKTKQNKT